MAAAIAVTPAEVMAAALAVTETFIAAEMIQVVKTSGSEASDWAEGRAAVKATFASCGLNLSISLVLSFGREGGLREEAGILL